MGADQDGKGKGEGGFWLGRGDSANLTLSLLWSVGGHLLSFFQCSPPSLLTAHVWTACSWFCSPSPPSSSLPASLSPPHSSVAVAAPQVYHTIAEAFAAALKCLTPGGTGTGPEGGGEGGGAWGGRTALKDATVRVSRMPHRRRIAACPKRLAGVLKWRGMVLL